MTVKKLPIWDELSVSGPQVSHSLPKYHSFSMWCPRTLKECIYNTLVSLLFFREHFMLPDSPQIKHINKIYCAKRTVPLGYTSMVSEKLCKLRYKSFWIYMDEYWLLLHWYIKLKVHSHLEKKQKHVLLINKIRTFKYLESSL